MSAAVVKAAVLGLGPQGRRIVGAIETMPGIELCAVVDRRHDALASLAFKNELLRLESVEDLWRCSELDLVCVATNGPSHCTMVLQALEAGVGRVMVEKPMACSLAECQLMKEAARSHGARLAVNQSRRHSPFYRWLRQQLRSGIWGQPRCLWIQRPGIGLGCLATHSVDLARFLTDREALSVTAWVDEPIAPNPRGSEFVDPGGLIVLQMAEGLRAVVAQIEDGAGPMSIEIVGTGARIRVDEKSGQVEIVERDLSIRPGPHRPPVFRERSVPNGLSARTSMPDMIRGLLEELVSDSPMECDAVHGAAAVEILAACHLSAERGNVPISLPLAAPEDLNRWLPVT